MYECIQYFEVKWRLPVGTTTKKAREEISQRDLETTGPGITIVHNCETQQVIMHYTTKADVA